MCFVFCENYMSYDAHFHILSNLIFFVLKRVYYFYSFTQEISDKILKKSICIFWGGIYMNIYLLFKSFKILKIELYSAKHQNVNIFFLNKNTMKISLQRKGRFRNESQKWVYMQNITNVFVYERLNESQTHDNKTELTVLTVLILSEFKLKNYFLCISDVPS